MRSRGSRQAALLAPGKGRTGTSARRHAHAGGFDRTRRSRIPGTVAVDSTSKNARDRPAAAGFRKLLKKDWPGAIGSWGVRRNRQAERASPLIGWAGLPELRQPCARDRVLQQGATAAGVSPFRQGKSRSRSREVARGVALPQPRRVRCRTMKSAGGIDRDPDPKGTFTGARDGGARARDQRSGRGQQAPR